MAPDFPSPPLTGHIESDCSLCGLPCPQECHLAAKVHAMILEPRGEVELLKGCCVWMENLFSPGELKLCLFTGSWRAADEVPSAVRHQRPKHLDGRFVGQS